MASTKFKAEIKLYKNDLIYILTRLFDVGEDDVILDEAVFDEKDHVCTVMKEIDFFSDLKDEKPEYVPKDTHTRIRIANSPYIPYNPTGTIVPPTLDPPCTLTADSSNTATYDVDADVTNEVT